jgi:hypothetical protein
MTCPYHSGDERGSAGAEGDGEADSNDGSHGDDAGKGGFDRRSFLKSALAIGGASALSTTVGLFGMPDSAAAADPENRVGVADRANRQHAWNAYERRVHGTFAPPEHHLLLFADYEGTGEPTAADRTEAREAFDRLERAFRWHHDGLLFTVGYSVSYFERFEDDPPRGLQTDNGAIPRMLSARQLIDGPTIPVLNHPEDALQPTEPESEEERSIDLTVTLPREDPVADDDYDVCLHLASDHVQNLLAAEQALWGERTDANGVDFSAANLDGILTRPTEYPDRRTGFVGNDNLADNVDEVGEEGSDARERFEESLADGAELSMGYNDLYKNSMPREDNVTILEDQRFLFGKPNWQPPGVFANGSIMHVSRLDNDLGGWYGDNDDAERRHRMFSSHHTKDDVGEVGENLAPRESNAPTAEDKPEDERIPMRDFSSDTYDVAERTEEDFREGRHIGHAQKTARARAQLEAHFRNEDGGRPIDLPQRDDPVAAERRDDLSGTDADPQVVETGFLRRDFNTIDGGRHGTHFVALQAFSIYLAYMRHAMNGVDFDTAMIAQPTTDGPTAGFDHDADDGENPEHGILEYVTTRRRGNFVVPPIRQRALPHASAITLVGADADPETGLEGATLPQYENPDGTFTVGRAGDRFVVRIDDDGLAAAVDPESVRFGFYRDVNAGGGAEPLGIDAEGAFAFDVEDTRLPEEFDREDDDDERPDDGTVRARLYAERASDRRPVFGTTTLATALERADRDDDGAISEAELSAAVRAWARGTYSDAGLKDVIDEWIRAG